MGVVVSVRAKSSKDTGLTLIAPVKLNVAEAKRAVDETIDSLREKFGEDYHAEDLMDVLRPQGWRRTETVTTRNTW